MTKYLVHTVTGTQSHYGYRFEDTDPVELACGAHHGYRPTASDERTLEELAGQVTCKNCAERVALAITRSAR
jgi:hypothetical protein